MKQNPSKLSSMATISVTTILIILSIFPTTHSLILPQNTIKKNSMIIKMNLNKNNNLIQSTCKATPNYDLCISTLQSDPRTADANHVPDLGLIIVDALKTKAISTVEKINMLKMSNPEYNLPLFECSIMYNAILKADVPEAVEGLRKGVPKFAEAGMDDAALEARICEQSFKGILMENPLSDMNKAVYDLSVVAKFIIRLLL